jgi:AcrR family transcriptional regulator
MSSDATPTSTTAPTDPTAGDPAPGASRPRRADARRNRQRLLDVALTAFTEQGIDAPLDDIARRAGVGIGTLYRHFPSREALVDALIRGGVDDLCRRSDELAGTADPLEGLARWLRELVDHASRFRGLAAAIVAAGGRVHERHEGALDASCALVHGAAGRLMGRAREAGRLRGDVDDADVVDMATSVAWITEHAPRDDQQTDRLLALVLDAVSVPAAPRASEARER